MSCMYMLSALGLRSSFIQPWNTQSREVTRHIGTLQVQGSLSKTPCRASDRSAKHFVILVAFEASCCEFGRNAALYVVAAY